MIKLPKSGVAFQKLPCAGRRLDWIAACATREFNRQIQFSPQQRSDIGFRLGMIVGSVQQDAQRPSTKAVAGSLNSIGAAAKRLQVVSSFSQSGFIDLTPKQAAAVGILMERLAADTEFREPEKLQDFLLCLSNDRESISTACEKASAEMKQYHGGRGGAPRLAWYDDFTLLLLEICKQFQLSTSLGRDRIDSSPKGHLFRLATAMEILLPPELRAKNPETRYDRLEKALNRVGTPQGKT